MSCQEATDPRMGTGATSDISSDLSWGKDADSRQQDSERIHVEAAKSSAQL